MQLDAGKALGKPCALRVERLDDDESRDARRPSATRPPISAVAMLPPPMKAMSHSGLGSADSGGSGRPATVLNERTRRCRLCGQLHYAPEIRDLDPLVSRRFARRRSPSPPAPPSTLPRSPPPDPPSCPSTACRRAAPRARLLRSTGAARRTAARCFATSAVGSAMPMKPREREPRQRSDVRRQHHGPVGRHAALRRLAADVDLDQHVERRPVGCARSGQALGDLQPVDAFDPVEHLGRERRLVALERSDQHPLRGRRGRQAPRAWPRPPARSSRRTTAGPAACTARTAADGNVLETASSVTSSGARPACARRLRDARLYVLQRLLVAGHNPMTPAFEAAAARNFACYNLIGRQASRDYRWTSPSSWPSP